MYGFEHFVSLYLLTEIKTEFQLKFIIINKLTGPPRVGGGGRGANAQGPCDF